MSSRRLELDQARAKQAWDDITEVVKDTRANKGKYRSLTRSMPAMLQTNGLGQMLAFLRAKAAEREHLLLYQDISSWVMTQLEVQDSPDRLLEWLLDQDTAHYRRATNETAAYMNWLKRFAEAVLPAPVEE